MIFEIISLALNLLLSGGLIVTLVTLRSTAKKAKEEAKTVQQANEESAMQTFQLYIVEPLKKELKSLRYEVSKFRKAIDKINVCDHAADCPVKFELREQEANERKASDNNPQK